MMTFRSSKIKQALIIVMILSAAACAQDNGISHTTEEKIANYQVVDTGQVHNRKKVMLFMGKMLNLLKIKPHTQTMMTVQLPII